MDAVVQLLRNALCCIKDFQLFDEYGIHDATLPALLYSDIPAPIHQTTPLEYLICLTQFYAFVSTSKSGFNLMISRKYQKLERLLEIFKGAKIEDHSTAQRIILESLIQEMEAALRNIVVGICVFPIGVAFLWLSANSLHITETNWIGGLPALIHALTVMEVFLVPLLYFMWIDSSALVSKAKRMLDTKKIMEDSGCISSEKINSIVYSWLVATWQPFWKEADGIDLTDEVKIEKLFSSELKEIETNIKEFGKEGGSKVGLDATTSLESASWRAKKEGQREFLYFVLNFVAFYGYLLGILAYYFPDGDDGINAFPVVTSLNLGMTTSVADWTGNFAGDFCWTVEPVVILLSPIFLLRFSPTQKIKKE